MSLIYFSILWLKTLKYYSKIFIEMSSLNTNIREFLSGDDENLILKALYFIWTKTNKKIESCTFDQDSDRVRISFKGIGYYTLTYRRRLIRYSDKIFDNVVHFFSYVLGSSFISF